MSGLEALIVTTAALSLLRAAFLLRMARSIPRLPSAPHAVRAAVPAITVCCAARDEAAHLTT